MNLGVELSNTELEAAIKEYVTKRISGHIASAVQITRHDHQREAYTFSAKVQMKPAAVPSDYKD